MIGEKDFCETCGEEKLINYCVQELENVTEDGEISICDTYFCSFECLKLWVKVDLMKDVKVLNDPSDEDEGVDDVD